jgi:hypothetical protein
MARHRRSSGNPASRVTRSTGGGRSWGQGLVQAAEPGMNRPRPITVKIRRTRLPSGMTSRSPPPSARAHVCTATSTLNPDESQNRVRVISTTTVPCPRLPASSRCHVPAARFSPPGPDSTTRAPTRDNATAGTPHLAHVDLRDLHDHRGVPVLTTAQFRPEPVHTRQPPQVRNTPEP